ncbi:Mobile element protein [Candidatus Enterovibrio altilux]|uniref:Mobile element protein n=1 Tax=Candidatus Enterovibrio altilux TaxID=1927128 RepID=A0A291B9Q4_9GAMM|nr:Mobile element protein [Candidatus Enterovibrio luxaltus]
MRILMPLSSLPKFINFVFKLAQLPLSCPHYSCMSKRIKMVDVPFKMKKKGSIQYLSIDFTG